MNMKDKYTVDFYRDTTSHCCELHYPDKDVIFVNEIIAQDDMAMMYQFLGTVQRCCGYKFHPQDVIELLGWFYKHREYDGEPKCIL